MKRSLIVGVDVSKLWLDCFIKPLGQHFRINNTKKGFDHFFKRITEQAALEEILVVMEYTGFYSIEIEKFMTAMKISYAKLPALQIKRSLGVTRGKNDKVDAQRIAEFGWLRREELKASSMTSEDLIRLKVVMSHRKSLIKARTGFKCTRKELLNAKLDKSAKIALNSLNKTIELLSKEIKKMEQEAKKILESNEVLNKNNKLLQSIPAIGPVVSINMIIATENFEKINNARSFNCYAGIAPFKHESGLSKGKARVSHLANKEMKTLMNLAAFAAVRLDKEIIEYYYRKVKEGKPRMSVINAIRAKLALRMFAIIKKQEPYVIEGAA